MKRSSSTTQCRSNAQNGYGGATLNTIASSVMLVLFVLAAAGSLAERRQGGPTIREGPPSQIRTPIEAGIQTKASARLAISGQVTTDGGAPLPNAGVQLRSVGKSDAQERKAVTANDGKFRVADLPPGAYSIEVSAPGYVALSKEDSDRIYRPGDFVSLVLTKGAVITGSVSGPDGRPAVGALVRAIRVRDRDGRTLTGSESYSRERATDDRGIYRLFGLADGSYVVSAGGLGPDSQEVAYAEDAPTYFPSSRRANASEIVLHSGEVAAGVDIQYQAEPGHSISGRISGSGVGVKGAYRVFNLVNPTNWTIEATVGYWSLRDCLDCFFFFGIPDGDYELFAEIAFGTAKPSASKPLKLTVAGADVTGLNLRLDPLASIAGSVILEPLKKADQSGCSGTPPALLD
ncbi:MAG: carboxypeptidase regulatory-like domain-containing protein, partial [Blastocatellia bacterium]